MGVVRFVIEPWAAKGFYIGQAKRFFGLVGAVCFAYFYPICTCPNTKQNVMYIPRPKVPVEWFN